MLDMLEELRDVITTKREECENKRWKYTVGGKEVVLRDVAEKVITWISKFKEIGDIAVGFDQVHAALPWAAVRFLLQIAVAGVEQIGALLVGADTITYLTNRCKIYEVLYLYGAINPTELCVTNLETALVELYAAMLRFLAEAVSIYEKRSGGRSVHALLNPLAVQNFVENCRSLEQRVDIEARLCESVHSRSADSKLSGKTEQLKQILEDLQKPLLRVDDRVGTLWEKSNKQDRLEILMWISSIPHEDDHTSKSEGRTAGTGQWLLDSGAGKTKLVSKVVDDLRGQLTSRPNDEGFASFYCDRNQTDRQDPKQVLRCLVKQLSTSSFNRAHGVLQPALVELYRKKQLTAGASVDVPIEECAATLLQLLDVYPQTTIVLDALDECDRRTRKRLIEVLDSLVSQSPKPVKIFISSRPDQDIKTRFETGPNVSIKATDNEKDIAKFVEQMMKKNGSHLSDDLRKRIVSTLLVKSQGMFQWASLMIGELLELHRERDIIDQLGKLPETLDKAYNEIFAIIRAQKGSKPDIAHRAFQWVACSYGPLSTEQLVAAVCQDPEQDTVTEVDVDATFILDACRNLLVLDSTQNVWRFSHLSVQEYVEQGHATHGQANALVANICLALLNDPIWMSIGWTSPRKFSSAVNSNPRLASADPRAKPLLNLYEYAIYHWQNHVQRHSEGPDDTRLSRALQKFLGSADQSSPAYQHWLGKSPDEDFGFGLLNSPTCNGFEAQLIQREQLRPASSALISVCALGFDEVLADWWSTGTFDVEQRNTGNESLLYLAVKGGHRDVARLLLSFGADPSPQGGPVPLVAAIVRKDEEIVRLLLRPGADVNARDRALQDENTTALQAAAREGRDNIAGLMLRSGANVQAKDGSMGTALQAAAYLGHESLVKLLLSAGAEVNAGSKRWCTALQAAADGGNLAIVSSLLNSGAEIDKRGDYYGTALQAAAACYYYSALQVAAARGGESALQVVEMLLAAGADVNAYGGSLYSALQAAAVRGDEKALPMVETLLTARADVNAYGGYYYSALQAAAASGGERALQVVEMLLTAGANVNAYGGQCYSALRAAAACKDEEAGLQTVELLLMAGADVDARGGSNNKTALQTAIEYGREAIVQLLLSSGADTSLITGNYGCALPIAVYTGQKSTVKKMIEAGADVNTVSEEHGSPLTFHRLASSNVTHAT
ncbi:hypothetical protein B0A49_00003 [Cryomyces minteri]|uniref:Uncharacterized protein n=1 Tax=Cryomyces minteri TaxID=331657 RepID=A0A4U0Y4A6_9PEZI|nr:hypothetical protein B0A49_00003 [Cryomyces minteri]